MKRQHRTKQLEVYYRHTTATAQSMRETKASARGLVVQGVREIETLLRRVVAETGPLRGLPTLSQHGVRPELRAVRFRASRVSRGERLERSESAFVLTEDGFFAVAEQGGQSTRPVEDAEIIAEDGLVAATLLRDVLDRHTRLLEQRTERLRALERWSVRLCELLEEAPR